MKYQLTCPKCKYEFHYDNGYYDDNITRLGREIAEINCQIADYNCLSDEEKKKKKDWYNRTKRAYMYKTKEIGELKAFRKISDQQVKHYEYDTFKRLVRDLVGQEEYMRLIGEMKKELEAYTISGQMRHEYTRSGSKSSVTSLKNL